MTTGREANEIIRDLRAALVTTGLGKTDAGRLIGNVRARGYRIELQPEEIRLNG